ncbi:MAG: beta-N-acetylglucosaminidase domain-containing protein [Candidatus Fermentibacteraceae bacterium]|nr:beta-N-acetylglucosaminidase domain-containing protein [Candidatus Fermentibacteraceae bacterium]
MVRGGVEGFYGRPYEGGRRSLLLRLLSRLEDPAYIYAPKNDTFHRLGWREDYPAESRLLLEDDIHLAADSGIRFIFGISPWGFRDDEYPALRRKARAAMEAGSSGVAVLFDDIPQRADPELALRQLNLVGEALEGIGGRVLLCPSLYCTELLVRHSGEEYLSAWSENVNPEWTSMWTGREVVSRRLDDDSLCEAAGLLGGRPAIWDNLLADDYCLRRVYLSGLDQRIPADHEYFLNPPECFPAALYGVYSLVKATGAGCPWPGELGTLPAAWEVLAGFHHTPWSTAGVASEMIRSLSGALHRGPDAGLLAGLEETRLLMCRFLDDLEVVPWGWELAPYVRDLGRMVGWWSEILRLPSRSERISRLQHLMFRRLPFDHPLASMTAELAGSHQEGDL